MNYEFGSFRLDTAKRRLFHDDGQVVPLTPKAIETLRVLIERRDQIVLREDLMNAIWPDVAVEDGNLSVTVSMLRKALSDDGNGNKLIETIPKQGYRFLGAVRVIDETDVVLTVEKYTEKKLTIDEHLNVDRRLITLFSSVPRVARVIAIGTFLILAIAASAYLVRSRSSHSAGTRIQSLAVIPFRAMNDQSPTSHKGLGLADILITRLSSLRDIRVRPTAAVLKFEIETPDLQEVGSTLNVEAVLTGTIYQSNDKIRVIAQLIRLQDESPIWAGTFENPIKDELKLQDEIALQVVDALALNLTGEERGALTKRYTENEEAFELYLKGRNYWNKRSYEGLSEAQHLFRKAIDIDPNFALAYAGLADSMIFGSPSPEVNDCIAKAIELNPNLAEPYASLGFVRALHQWQWKEAEESFKKSIELNPNYPTAHHWYAILLGIEGRFAEAKSEMQVAIDINPLSYNYYTDMGQIYYFTGEYDKAKDYCNRALQIYPDFTFAHQNLSAIYLQLGDYESFIREYNLSFMTLIKTPSNVGYDEQARATAIEADLKLYRTMGTREYFEDLLARESRNTAVMKNPGALLGQAWLYLFLGNKEKALESLERAFETRAFGTVWVKADPKFQSLRNEPRYKALLQKMELPLDN
jgi:DNA-binding winged helix-turn-helix (wHTH) protein/TolB-like protein